MSNAYVGYCKLIYFAVLNSFWSRKILHGLSLFANKQDLLVAKCAIKHDQRLNAIPLQKLHTARTFSMDLDK